jgi:hypothetical protein
MFKKLKQFAGSLLGRIFVRRRNRFLFARMLEEPEQIQSFRVYVLGEEGYEWTAVFVCPCGCGDVIRLNLLEGDHRPTWRVSHGPNKHVTVHPSVWRNVGCSSHFIIREGLVHWC